MSRKSIREQLTPAKAESLATLTYRLQPPDGSKVRQGEYRLTEGQWLDLIKGLEAATKEQRL